ncbi:sensor histidine kinase [Luteimicrobium sp. DT211]|uniref:sensor histidine kinase n=1 Tax=Luteimicrobium sp. DT211 TaxID=3393412 RepID=UPI003CF9239D
MSTTTAPTPPASAPHAPGPQGPAAPAAHPQASDQAAVSAVRRLQPVGFFTGPFRRRTWSELLFLVCTLVTGSVGLAYFFFTIGAGVGFGVTVVGLYVGGALVVGARMWGGLYRAQGRALLGVDVPAPLPFRRGRGFWGGMGRMLGDTAGWRALAFLFLSFVTNLVGAVFSLIFFGYGLGALTYGIWYRWLPLQQATDGTWHRGAQYGPDWFVDTPERIWVQAGAGVLLLLLWPQVQRGFVHVTRLLIVNLLGPTKASLRVADLERARGRTVEDADARLRRIERELHDGTQARLVAVAMQLGEAKEQLAGSPSGDGRDATVNDALGLVTLAHDSTKEALTELREIARGIHPPVLDNGLAAALGTLAARSPVRTVVDVDPAVAEHDALASAIEALAYYTVAELVTNAAKHAHASTVWVLVEPAAAARPPAPGSTEPTRFVRIRVRDDGVGGAAVNLTDPRPGEGSGLAGLVERVRAVDGTLDVTSPVGAGTRVDVLLPTVVPGEN